MWRDHEAYDKSCDLSYSIGMSLKEDGSIEDVRMDGPASKAGLTPTTKIIAVNGRKFNPQLLRETVAATAKSTAPIEIMVEDGEFYKTFHISYRGSERYPHLVRDESKPDLLGAIIAPHAK